jgi:hypothetical protein
MVKPPLTDNVRSNNSVGSTNIITPKEINPLQGAYYLVMPYSPPEEYVDPVTLLRKKFEASGQQACQRSAKPL